MKTILNIKEMETIVNKLRKSSYYMDFHKFIF